MNRSKEIWGEDALEFKYVCSPGVPSRADQHYLGLSDGKTCQKRFRPCPEFGHICSASWLDRGLVLGSSFPSSSEFFSFWLRAVKNCVNIFIRIKCLLFTLLRSIEFSLPIPEMKINARLAVVQRPIVVGKEDEGPQMPLMLKSYSGY